LLASNGAYNRIYRPKKQIPATPITITFKHLNHRVFENTIIVNAEQMEKVQCQIIQHPKKTNDNATTCIEGFFVKLIT
jgi:hypothetical protein